LSDEFCLAVQIAFKIAGVLLSKETQDIEHIKNGVPDGCKCSLCEQRDLWPTRVHQTK